MAYDSWISYYVNDTLIASTGDYTLQKDDKGQSTVLTEGSLGLLNWNGEMTFQNTYYTELNDQNTPELKISRYLPQLEMWRKQHNLHPQNQL